MPFERGAQVACRLAELRHHLAEISRQLRQLFRPENDERHNKNNDQMWNAQHFGLLRCRFCIIEEGQRRVKRLPSGMLYFIFGAKRGTMDVTQSSKRGVVLLTLVLAISALLGGWLGPTVRATAAGATDLQDSVKGFTRVLSVVERNYADPVDVDKAIYEGAIPGMLHVLDPHSNFFDPKQYALFREEQQGKYYGVGMTIAARENQTVVVAPFVGSPAFKAGIRPGDVISKVDGKSCATLTSIEVADMLKGAKGTTVHIALVREGWAKPIEVTIVRDEIPRPGVEYFSMIRPGIGYVRVTTFNETTDSDLLEALHQLDYAKLDGLILDLRTNGGGLLSKAFGMGGGFFV